MFPRQLSCLAPPSHSSCSPPPRTSLDRLDHNDDCDADVTVLSRNRRQVLQNTRADPKAPIDDDETLAQLMCSGGLQILLGTSR